MADYYTKLSFAFSIEEAHRPTVEAIVEELIGEESDASPVGYLGFEYEIQSGDESGTIAVLVHADDAQPDLDNVANFCRRYLERCAPDDAIGFAWSNDCSRPTLDAYGGGACFVTAKDARWNTTSRWLYEQHAAFAEAMAGAADRK